MLVADDGFGRLLYSTRKAIEGLQKMSRLKKMKLSTAAEDVGRGGDDGKKKSKMEREKKIEKEKQFKKVNRRKCPSVGPLFEIKRALRTLI